MRSEVPASSAADLMPLLLMIGGAFALGLAIYVGGYFLFLKLQKDSLAKGAAEAEAEAKRDREGS